VVTRELMWVKTIPIKKFEFSYVVRIPFGQTSVPGKVFNYGPVVDGIAKGMEQQYPELVGVFYNLLDPEEMDMIKKQAQELKNKKDIKICF